MNISLEGIPSGDWVIVASSEDTRLISIEFDSKHQNKYATFKGHPESPYVVVTWTQTHIMTVSGWLLMTWNNYESSWQSAMMPLNTSFINIMYMLPNKKPVITLCICPMQILQLSGCTCGGK